MRPRALLAVFALASWPAAAQSSSGDLAARIMSGLAALPDRQAAFTSVKTISALAAPVRSSGTLGFRHPDHLEKLTLAPKPERLVIEGDTLTIAEGSGPARTLALSQHPALRALAVTMTATLAGDLPRLRSVFTVAADGTPDAWRMVLTPADPQLRRFLASVTLTGGAADLRELRIVQQGGDTETLQIQTAK